MKSFKIIALALLLSIPHMVGAQPYKSAFGFRTDVTDNWLIVSRETLQDNPDLLNFDTADMRGMDPALVKQIRKMANSGRFELLYYLKSDKDFKDNINLFVSNPSHANLDAVEGQLCGSLQAEIQGAYNRTNHTNIYHCERRRIAAVDMINYSFDGAIIGSRSHGYLFNAAPAGAPRQSGHG